MVRPTLLDKDNLPERVEPSRRLRKDLTNKRIGMLTVLYPTSRPEGKKTPGLYWVCACDCGNYCMLSSDALNNGHDNKSCGCLFYTCDGQSRDKLFIAYRNMIDKCYNPKNESYSAYHNQFYDIEVCDDWLKSYDKFKDWSMSHGYDTYKRLYRNDNKGDYCPENCKWDSLLSKSEQRKVMKGWFD